MRTCYGRQGPAHEDDAFLVAETTHAAGLRTPRHEHPFACAHVVLSGVYEEESGGARVSAGVGDVVLKPAGVAHSNRFGLGGSRTLRVQFDASALGTMRRAMPAGLTAFDLTPASGITARLRAELSSPDGFTPLVVHGLCLELLGEALDAGRRVGRGAPALRRAAEALRSVPSERLSIGAIAQDVGVNRTHLARLFRRAYGCSMGEYARAARLSRALRLLESGDDPIAQVAVRSGFSDQSHLTRACRRLVGVTPTQWRRRSRA